MITEEDIDHLIGHPETEHVEMKRARHDLPSTFWESYSSFANTDGGIILLGVSENNGMFDIEGFNAFSLISIGDRSGTGLCDLYARWRKLNLPLPELSESYDPARTHLLLSLSRNAQELSDGKVKVEESVFSTKEKTAESKVKRTLGSLPASARSVYASLAKNPSMTYAGLQEQLGFSSATVAKAIGLLVSNGYIFREGGRKTGQWKIVS